MSKIPILWTCPKCSGHLFFWSQRPTNGRGPTVYREVSDGISVANSFSPTVLVNYPVCTTCNEIMFDANLVARSAERDSRHIRIMVRYLFPIMIVVFLILAIIDSNIQ